MVIYNKLVRDKIPQKIIDNGEVCKVRELTDEEYMIELNKKILEEVYEYLESGEIEELADIEEVLRSIVKAKGLSYEDLDNIRQAKVEKRGGFDNKLFLEYTDEAQRQM